MSRKLLQAKTFINLFFSLFAGFVLAEVLPAYDFAQYWAASQLFFDGQNPYQLKNLLALQSELSFNTLIPFSKVDLPVVMYNPPLIFPFLIPFGFFEFTTSKAIFYSFSFFIYLQLGLSLQGLSKLRMSLFLGLVLLFPFIRNQLFYGQIAILPFLAIAIYLYARSSRPYLSGVALACTLIKPHLFIFVYGAEIFLAFKNRTYQLLTAFLMAGLVLLFLPFIWDQQIYSSFYLLHQENSPTSTWMSASLSSLLTRVTGYVAYLPVSIAGALGCLYYWYKDKTENIFTALLITLCFGLLSSPYLWSYDLLSLLVPIFYLFNQQSFSGKKIFILFSYSLILTSSYFDLEHHAAFIFAILIVHLGVWLRQKQEATLRNPVAS